MLFVRCLARGCAEGGAGSGPSNWTTTLPIAIWEFGLAAAPARRPSYGVGFANRAIATARIRGLVHALCGLSRAHETAPRAAPHLAGLDRAAADFYLANSCWLAAPVAATSDLWGRLGHHLVSTARHWAAVLSLCDFRLARWCSLSIGGWQPIGAVAPAIYFLLDPRRRWPSSGGSVADADLMQ